MKRDRRIDKSMKMMMTEVPIETHRKFKVLAANNDMTMAAFMRKMMDQAISQGI